MNRVTHPDRRSVVPVQRTDIIQRIDSRLVSLSLGQVYFVPESRLVAEKDANIELQRYKDANGQVLRS
jgi:hypothetical protein